MNRGRRNFRGRGRGRFISGPRRFQTKSAARRENNGKFFRVSRVPPTIVDNPWNHVVLPFNNTSCKCFDANDLIVILKTYLNITSFVAPFDLAVRFIRCKLWVEKTDVHPLSKNASVRFFSLIGEQFIAEQALAPGDVAFMSTGYEWPRAQSLTVFYAGRTDKIMAITPTDTAAVYYIQLHMLWRIERPCECPSIDIHLNNCRYGKNLELFGSVNSNVRTFEDRIKDLEHKFERFNCNWDDE